MLQRDQIQLQMPSCAWLLVRARQDRIASVPSIVLCIACVIKVATVVNYFELQKGVLMPKKTILAGT